MRRLVGLLATGLTLSACWWDGSGLPEATTLTAIAATDAQQGFAGALLAEPLTVLASEADGQRVPRARVRWEVVGGADAVLSDSLTVADGTGRAKVSLTLGADPGVVTVRARLEQRRDVVATFVARGLEAPVVTALAPDTFSAGQQLALVGTGLSDSLPVEIAGVRATVLGASPLGQGVLVEVPSCLPPGPVTVQVRFPGGASAPIAGHYVASDGTQMLSVGEYRSFDPAAMDGCASFPPSGQDGTEFLLVPQATTGIEGASADYALRSGATTPAAAHRAAMTVPESPPFAERFHAFLRGREAEIAAVPHPPRTAEPAPAALAPIEVGDRRRFRVCSTVTCQELADFTLVTAEAKYVGEHAAIFLDLAAPEDLSQQYLASLGRTFDLNLYEVATTAFGAESDIDLNGHVLILMTPVVNGLTPTSQCEISVVTGFFYAIDIDPNWQRDARSNKGEVFYALTPDPSGETGCAHPLDRVNRLVPVTFVHELQHMISYHQHVLVRGGNAEALWLNEGMSHLAEEMAALQFEAQGDGERFSQFAIGNLFNAYQFLRATDDNYVAFREGTGTLAERGGAWLFLRWLVDQFGPSVVRRLEETELTGAANVAAAAAEPFATLLADWFLATYVSDLPGFDPPPRLTYRTWSLRSTYESLWQQSPGRFDVPFPIEPLVARADSLAVTGILHAGSGAYISAQQPIGGVGFTLRFTNAAGGAVDPAVGPRLSVIRLR